MPSPWAGQGITNKQAKFLAALCRELGWAYTGNGMTRIEASDAIKRALKRLEARRELALENERRELHDDVPLRP